MIKVIHCVDRYIFGKTSPFWEADFDETLGLTLLIVAFANA